MEIIQSRGGALRNGEAIEGNENPRALDQRRYLPEPGRRWLPAEGAQRRPAALGRLRVHSGGDLGVPRPGLGRAPRRRCGLRSCGARAHSRFVGRNRAV